MRSFVDLLLWPAIWLIFLLLIILLKQLLNDYALSRMHPLDMLLQVTLLIETLSAVNYRAHERLLLAVDTQMSIEFTQVCK